MAGGGGGGPAGGGGLHLSPQHMTAFIVQIPAWLQCWMFSCLQLVCFLRSRLLEFKTVQTAVLRPNSWRASAEVACISSSSPPFCLPLPTDSSSDRTKSFIPLIFSMMPVILLTSKSSSSSINLYSSSKSGTITKLSQTSFSLQYDSPISSIDENKSIIYA